MFGNIMLVLKKNTKITYTEWFNLTMAEGSAILMNKNRDWTSFDVVAKLRSNTKLNDLKINKIGHCGTLDPFAEGLLIICLGKATKAIESFQNLPKQYLATIKIGATTKTLDITAAEENIVDISHIAEDDIKNASALYIGKLEQIPPMFSAKKIAGKKLYELARKNIELELMPSKIEIYSIEILKIDLPHITCLIDCSKGTYVRALARDIGKQLGVGGYLTALTRTAIGNYKVEEALSISDFLEFRNSEKLNII